MFTAKEETKIPGYTGYQPSEAENLAGAQSYVGQTNVPGYQGFVPGVSAENVHGKTYGTTTNMSISGSIPRTGGQIYESTATHSYQDIQGGYKPREREAETDEPEGPPAHATR